MKYIPFATQPSADDALRDIVSTIATVRQADFGFKDAKYEDLGLGLLVAPDEGQPFHGSTFTLHISAKRITNPNTRMNSINRSLDAARTMSDIHLLLSETGKLLVSELKGVKVVIHVKDKKAVAWRLHYEDLVNFRFVADTYQPK